MIPLQDAMNRFRDLHVRAIRYYARVFEDLGLTLPKYAFLSQLSASGPMPLTEVSHRLLISKPATSTLAHRLENEGLIQRIQHPTDRRSFILSLSAKGRKITLCAQKAMLQLVVSTFKGFPESKRETVIQFYAKLADLIETSTQRASCTRKKS